MAKTALRSANTERQGEEEATKASQQEQQLK